MTDIWLTNGFYATEDKPLSLVLQTVFHLSCLLIQSISHQLGCKDNTGDSVKSAAKGKVKQNFLIQEGNQVAKVLFALCRSMLAVPTHLVFLCLDMASKRI